MDHRLSLAKYLAVVAVIFLMVYLPYFLPIGEVEGYLLVYGVPIVAVSLIFGRQILGKAAKNNVESIKFSLGSFGGFFLIGLFISAVVLAVIFQIDPSAQQLLEKPNPALDVTPDVAWIMMAVSMLVIGPAEEYLFRGFMYGGLLSVSKGKHWFSLAVISAVIFALAHGYYFVIYSSVSPVFFIQLTAFGVAMAVAYYWSGGNLLGPALVHGLNDLLGFLSVATSGNVGLAARGVFVVVCLIFTVYILLKKVRIKTAKNEEEQQQLVPKTEQT